jgi:hypothetical protein
MRDSQDWEGRFRSFAVIAAAFVLAVAILTEGPPWSTTHVAPNPGPSGPLWFLDTTPPVGKG